MDLQSIRNRIRNHHLSGCNQTGILIFRIHNWTNNNHHPQRSTVAMASAKNAVKLNRNESIMVHRCSVWNVPHSNIVIYLKIDYSIRCERIRASFAFWFRKWCRCAVIEIGWPGILSGGYIFTMRWGQSAQIIMILMVSLVGAAGVLSMLLYPGFTRHSETTKIVPSFDACKRETRL